MSLTLKVPAADAGSQFTPAPAGVWPAVCVSITDLGTQTEEYNGEAKTARQILVRWELDTDERMGDGRPFALSKKFTASLHPKSSLHKLLVSWFGKAPSEGSFDMSKLLGRGCQVQVIHKAKQNGDIAAQVQAVMPLTKGMKAPEPGVTPFVFSLDDFDEDLFGSFGDGLKKWIAKSPEYQAIINPPPKQTVRVVPAQVAKAPAKNGNAAGFGMPREQVDLSDDLNDEVPW
jgi:hypothetical protein